MPKRHQIEFDYVTFALQGYRVSASCSCGVDVGRWLDVLRIEDSAHAAIESAIGEHLGNWEQACQLAESFGYPHVCDCGECDECMELLSA